MVLMVRGRTANVAAKIEAFKASVPGFKDLPALVAGHFYNCAVAFPCTSSIEFFLTPDSPPALYAWHDFWDTYRGSNDYAAIWDAYAEMIVGSVGDLWYEAVETANEIEVRAPIQLTVPEGELDAKNG